MKRFSSPRKRRCSLRSHLLFYYMVTLALSRGWGVGWGGKIGRGMMLTVYVHLVPRLIAAIPLNPVYAIMACKGKVPPRTDKEGPQGEQKCLFLFL